MVATSIPVQSSGRFRVADVSFETSSGDYSANGNSGRLQPKILMVLFCLVERRGQVVSKMDLFGRVWEDTNVGENVLAQAISELRRILGAAAIETIAKMGYRLAATVHVENEVSPANHEEAKASEARAATPRFRFWQILVLVVAGGWIVRALILAVQGKWHH